MVYDGQFFLRVVQGPSDVAAWVIPEKMENYTLEISHRYKHRGLEKVPPYT